VAIPKKGHFGVFQLREDRGTLDAPYISTETAERSFGVPACLYPFPRNLGQDFG